MSFGHREVISVTTAADGSATAYSAVVSGRIASIRYVKTDFADGSTITVTAEATGESIWTESSVNASATRAPRQATHTIAGAASLYAAAGTAVNAPIVLANDRVKVVIASGGNVKTGTFHVVFE
jgi:hypothetical protein